MHSYLEKCIICRKLYSFQRNIVTIKIVKTGTLIKHKNRSFLTNNMYVTL